VRANFQRSVYHSEHCESAVCGGFEGPSLAAAESVRSFYTAWSKSRRNAFFPLPAIGHLKKQLQFDLSGLIVAGLRPGEDAVPFIKS
jgi:hypothetical protein